MSKYRLMNVAQVRVQDAARGIGYDLRPQVVEITIGDAATIVAMWSLYDTKINPEHYFEPRLVGRLEIEGQAEVIDAAAGDFLTWEIRTERLSIHVRPYREESIWIDKSFANGPAAGATLKDLYQQKRDCMISLTMNDRLLRSTTNPTIRSMHITNIRCMRDVIEKIDRMILDAEDAKRKEGAR